MKLTNRSTLFSFLILCFLVFLSFRLLMPSEISDLNTPETEFSTERALTHLKVISEKPHYIGSPAHQEVREYLTSQLEILGLEVQIQEGFTLNKKWNVLAKPKNILARIPGREKGKALMLLAHYDSAPHSKSYGASDAGSGVVTILEGVRAYLASGQLPKNDLIILFSDAEEIGLMGAKLFVEEHPWVNDVGIVVNFEARGSGGPSNMILETNKGNATLVKEFVKANPSFPVASSLMYSVYKMLPNDTDSTIFIELADIDSYFFAFIDDHYHYHTSADTFENLDRNTLEHQGSYVMAVLSHFTESDLSNLKAEEDYIYFNMPFVKLINYPFSWIIPMLVLAILLFVVLVLYGIAKGKLQRNEIYKGFVPFLSALVLSGLIAYGGWKLMLKIYPDYSEILHGFTYNGHLYIASFVALTLTICFRFYGSFNRKERPVNLFIAPLSLWLVIGVLIALYLKGAAYFIIPVYFGLLMLYLMIIQKTSPILLMLFLCIPAIFIFAPLIQFFPVGLGLEMLLVSAVFTVLLFGLLVPVLASFKKKKIFSYLFFLLAIGCFVWAHFTSDFNEDRQKPNSLVYFQDVDSQQAFWVTYDQTMDEWTRSYLGNEPLKATDLISNVAESKYGTGFSYAIAAPGKEIPEPEVVLLSDTVHNNLRTIKLIITPQRTVNRIALFADKEAVFKEFKANGKSVPTNQSTGNAFDNRPTSTLLNFYVSDNDALEVEYSIPINSNYPLIIQEMSFDLLEHQQFTIAKRSKNEMPKPFISNDAVILQKSINPNSLRKIAQPKIIADSDETD